MWWRATVFAMQRFSRQCVSVNCSFSHFSKAEMAFGEQLANINFYQRLQKSVTETLHLLQKVYDECKYDESASESNVSRVYVFKGFRFKMRLMLRKLYSLQLDSLFQRFSATTLVLEEVHDCRREVLVLCRWLCLKYDINKSYWLGKPIFQYFYSSSFLS